MKLYKMTRQGLLVWWAKVENNTLSVHHGYLNGKKQVDPTDYETHEEAIEHAKRRTRHKIDREFYTPEVPTDLPEAPMDALNFKDHKHKLPSGVYVQPKLDGIRCIGTKNGLYTKRDSLLGSVPHIASSLAHLPEGIRLDGELYCHGMSFQDHLRLIKRDTPLQEASRVSYHVYDIIVEDTPFVERKLMYESVVSSLIGRVQESGIEAVPCFGCSLSEVENFIQESLSDYEGGMVRDPKGVYEVSKRSHFLQKAPFFNRGEYKIVDIEAPTKGAHEGAAIFICALPSGGTFRATPAMSLSRRCGIYRQKELFIGLWTRIVSKGFTEDGIPRCPKAHGIATSPAHFN